MATTANPSRDDFAALLEQTLGGAESFEGRVVVGTVTGIENDLAVIDVGLKSEGRVPLREFAAPGQKADLKVGDEVQVYVDRVENANGEAMLSRDRARREAAWDTLETEFAKTARVEGVIFGRVKGGFTVDLSGAVAFLPGSQVDIRPVRDVTPLMDIPQPFQILKMDRKRGNIVVSRRAVLEETRAEQRSGLIQSLAEGQVIDGVVKNITDYGAFVDLGGIDGLLHVTDLSYKRVNHPSEVLNIGDTVKVQIIRINRDTQRISLGMKQLESDPWDGAAAKYPVGEKLTGRVTNITEYGAFVELEAGIEGLVHVSEMSWTKKNVHPGKIVSTSQEVDVVVLEVDAEKRRISLGLKQAQNNPWEAFAAAHPVGTEVEGEVKNATEFGLFIGLDNDVDGMVHMSDIAWGISGEDALNLHRKGETVKAVVLAIEPDKERISLGMKQLERGGPSAASCSRRRRQAQQERGRHRHRSRSPRRGPRGAGRRRRRDRLHQAHRSRPRPRRAASGAFPGRPEVRRDGHRLRSFEEADLLGQGDADRRREAGRSAVWLVRFGRVAGRHPRRGPQGPQREELTQLRGSGFGRFPFAVPQINPLNC
jgi:small subunit ribosomal protein S1